MGIVSESRAAISCVFSDGGKTVTITGEGSDETSPVGSCNSYNSKDENGNKYTPSSDWKNTVTTVNIGNGIRRVGTNSFYDLSSLTNVTISGDVQYINNNAFGYNSNLSSVTFADESKLTTIEPNAFRNSGLTSVTIPEGVTTIGSSAFGGNKNLTSVTIPGSMENMDGAFYDCTKLTNVSFTGDGSNLTSFGGFNSTGLTSITIPEGVETISAGAFSSAKDLVSVTLPNSLKSIESRAFYGASSLESITIPEGVTSIGAYAFNGLSNLTSINIPSTLSSTSGEALFNGCPKLKELIIPDTLSVENVAGWNQWFFLNSSFTNIRCVDENGENSTNDSACVAAMSRYLPDEDGNCSIGYSFYCLQNVKKIGNTCVGKYFGNINGDGSCVLKNTCTNGGNLINTDTRQCVTPANCTGMYVADTVNKKCFKMPGCVNFADGACQECDNGYLTNSSGACIPADDCKNGLHADGGACVENPAGCNTFEGSRCTECNGGLLRQGAGCVSSCGEGYKLSNGACYRTHYTPAEAETVSGDTNTITLIYK